MSEEDTIELPSAPFDFFLWLRTDTFDSLLEQILVPYLKGKPGNKIRDDYKRKLYASFKVILLNLLHVHKHKGLECLAVPRDNNAIQARDRYSLKTISVGAFNEAYNALETADYIERISVGRQGSGGKPGRRSRVIVLPKLAGLFDEYLPAPYIFFERNPDEEVIVLRRSKRRGKASSIDYQDDDETLEQRKILRKINSVLQSHWYDLEMSDEDYEPLRDILRRRHVNDSKKNHFIDFSNRSLKRIYSNGSFSEGGRFYGGWWQQIPKDYRRYIKIDGKLAVEVDYSNMHPYILYSKKGLRPDGDAYKITGVSRKVVKRVFSTLLNKASERAPRGYNADSNDGLEWQCIVAKIKSKHPQIEEFFGKGVGLQLQLIDSKMAERVMLTFSSMNKPCLPLHDSFIVHHAMRDELEAIMRKAYEHVAGQAGIDLDCKDYFKLFSEEYAGKLDSQGCREVTFGTVDACQKEYSEYFTREMLWFKEHCKN